MDTRMIDVAIGVALVFALTSLLATALQELWASYRSLRGKYLLEAVCSFVGDDAVFAKTLMDQPLLLSLAKGVKGQSRLPSYIGSDAMVSTLVSFLTTEHLKVRANTPSEFVATLADASKRANGASSATLPKPEFINGLQSLVAGVEQDWPAFEARLAAWYDAVTERSTGWFKRHTQFTLFFFGLAAAVIANINPIVISARLWQDEALRKATVAVAEKVSAEYAAQSASAAAASTAASGAASAPPLPSLVKPPPTPAEQTRASLAALNDAVMRELSAAPSSARREALDTLLRRAIELRSALDASPRDHAGVQQALRALNDALPSDATTHPLRALHAGVSDAIAREGVTAGATAGTPVPRNVPRECRGLTDGAAQNYCLRLNDLNSLQSINLPIGWVEGAWPSYFDDGCNQAPEPDICGSLGMLASPPWWGNFLVALFGWFLTAIACTLGGPFWFDALSKFVRLRASGGKPDGAAPAAASASGEPPKNLVARSPATLEAASTAPPVPPAMSDALNDAERALSAAEVERVQRGLGLTGAEVTGVFDSRTRRAIKEWQTARGHEATAELTPMQVQDLLGLTGSTDDGYLA